MMQTSRRNSIFVVLLIVFIVVIVVVIRGWGLFFTHTPTEYSMATLVSPSNGPRLFDPNWSSDGTALVVASQELTPGGFGHLYIINLQSTNLEQITNNSNGFYDNPVWSPDGKHLAYWSNTMLHDGIGVINLDNLETNYITSGQMVSWSSYNDLVVVDFVIVDNIKSVWLRIVPYDGGSTVDVFKANAVYPIFTDMAWSPDGNYIALGVSLLNDLGDDTPTLLYIIDKMGNTKLQRSEKGIGTISWISNSMGVIYSIDGLRQISKFRLVTFDGGCTEFETSVWPMGSPRFSPDVRKLAFSSLDSRIYVADTEFIFGDDFLKHGRSCQ